ncbi:hypothetical protein [Streptomyces odonnellii]|uniref:hypothetical protein n=1 Tax=Streptomyces odonnellii TaxID=1417980 RepID=UPI00069770A7|nr:hypothetical protein [Streptomyces odonnellii]
MAPLTPHADTRPASLTQTSRESDIDFHIALWGGERSLEGVLLLRDPGNRAVHISADRHLVRLREQTDRTFDVSTRIVQAMQTRQSGSETVVGVALGNRVTQSVRCFHGDGMDGLQLSPQAAHVQMIGHDPGELPGVDVVLLRRCLFDGRRAVPPARRQTRHAPPRPARLAMAAREMSGPG